MFHVFEAKMGIEKTHLLNPLDSLEFDLEIGLVPLDFLEAMILILGGDRSWTKIPCKIPQLWWQEKKLWGKQPNLFLSFFLVRLVRGGSNFWAFVEVGQTRLLGS